MNSFIATHLVGVDAARYVTGLRSQTHLFGSTAGPFDALGGAAMTSIVMTELTFGSKVVFFADDQFLGWADAGSIAQQRFPALAENQTPGLVCDRAGVTDLIPSTDEIARQNAASQAATSSSGIPTAAHRAEVQSIIDALDNAADRINLSSIAHVRTALVSLRDEPNTTAPA